VVYTAVFSGIILAGIFNYIGLGGVEAYFLCIIPVFGIYALYNRCWVKGGAFDTFLIYCLSSLFFIMLQYIYVPAVLFYSGHELDFFYAFPFRLYILFIPGRVIQAATTFWLMYKLPV
jgi:hypothetical protein